MTTIEDVREHTLKARMFLADSDAEFASGERMQASEKLWGAASQAVMALAASRGRLCGSHRAMKNEVVALDNMGLVGAFAAAEKFHINFYHDAMEDYEVENDRPVVHWFVEEILSMVEGQ